MTLPVTVRPAESLEDWEFIRKAWKATYLLGGTAVQGADRDHYFAEMTRMFAAIMPTAQARMGCDPKDDDNRLAFAVFSGDELRFVYVLQDFRRMGIVPALLDGLEIKRYTFSTIQGGRRLKPRDRGWSFTPRFTLP
jgi:hypothetical protein